MKLFKWCLSGVFARFSNFEADLNSFIKTEYFLESVRGSELPYEGQVIGRVLNARLCKHKSVCIIFELDTTRVNINTFIPGFSIELDNVNNTKRISSWRIVTQPNAIRDGLEELGDVSFSINWIQNRELGLVIL